VEVPAVVAAALEASVVAEVLEAAVHPVDGNPYNTETIHRNRSGQYGLIFLFKNSKYYCFFAFSQ
jgi:hypothetical protein